MTAAAEITPAAVVLVTDDERFARRAEKALASRAGAVTARPLPSGSDAEAFATELVRDGVEVVAIGPGIAAARALELARAFDNDHPDVAVVLVARATPSLSRDALRAGVRGIVLPSTPAADLRRTVEDAAQMAARRRARHAAAEASAAPRDIARRIICVISPKGGSGKTTMATNLAVGLASRAPGEVAIVDLDLQFGDVAPALRLVPQHTMSDLARLTTLDATGLKMLLTPHPSGLFSLCAPESPAEGELIPADVAAGAITRLSSEFRYVVVDTSAGLNEHTLAAIDLATDLVLVAAMDVPGVRSLRKELDALDELQFTARRHVVLNRSDAKVGLASNDIAATLGLPIDVFVPSTRDIPASVNAGSPVLESNPRSPVAMSIASLVDRFVPAPASAAHARKRSWFSNFALLTADRKGA